MSRLHASASGQLGASPPKSLHVNHCTGAPPRPRPEVFPLDDQRDVIITPDSVIADGRELAGYEIAALIAQLDERRLETLWREMNRNYPLGTWVRGARSKRHMPDQVIGYARGGPGAAEHMLLVRTGSGHEIRMPVSEAETARMPGGDQ